MTIGELAAAVIDACEAEKVDHMVTGAFAYSLYGIARSTMDVDVVLSIGKGDAIACVVRKLDSIVRFDPQVQFDTLTWGRRQVGVARSEPAFKVELFELFDDARDVLAVQGTETLDMEYIRGWCREHGTLGRLETALAEIPPL